jgi:hypothetical protein
MVLTISDASAARKASPPVCAAISSNSLMVALSSPMATVKI